MSNEKFLSAEQLADLRAKAKAAPVGPWSPCDVEKDIVWAPCPPDRPDAAGMGRWAVARANRHVPETEAISGFISAANPAVVVALLDRIDRLEKALEAAPKRTFDSRCADALADEVGLLTRRHVVDSRSPVADALLDYRNPPSAPRADRVLALEANNAALLDLVRHAAEHHEWGPTRYQQVQDVISKPHPGSALLEVANLLRQHQRADEPDLLTTLRRLLEERERIAHMVSAEAHRKALVQAKNEGLQAAADHLKALLPEDTIFPATRKIVMTAVEGIIAMKERE